MEHFSSIWNVNDVIWLTFYPVIVLTSIPTQTWIEIDSLATMSAFATFSMFVKVLDWMRLFDQTSFYILLIKQTVRDISAFFLLLIISLLMFGIPMIMLNISRTEELALVDQKFSNWIPNMLINQYLLALGEFNLDNFESGSQAGLCYLFFVFATLFTQVTMLNMLIAIMGDTFARTMENRDLNSTKTKLELLGDLSANIYQSTTHGHEEDRPVERFLFVVTPDEDEQDPLGSWEGSISQMSKITEKRISQLEIKLDKRLSSLTDQAE